VELFKNSHDALKFAYNFVSEQYDRPLMNKLADKEGRTGKGLAGNDGAGQAGMIRQEVKGLGELHEAIVIASFAPSSLPCACRASCCSGAKVNREWSEAIHVITKDAMEHLSCKMSHYQLRRGIVERQFGSKQTISELATRCGVNRDTASEHNSIVTHWLTGEKKNAGPNAKVGEISRAIAAAGDRLSAAGMVGDLD
jgi:hypothetical protein